MKLAEGIKPISYLKTNTADVVRSVNETLEPVIITQNGEAKAVIQDIATYERTLETLALLKMLAQGKTSIEEGKARSFRRAVENLQSELRQKLA